MRLRTSITVCVALATLALVACSGGSAPAASGRASAPQQPAKPAAPAPATAEKAAPAQPAKPAAQPAPSGRTLLIGAIPDQSAAVLTRTFNGMATYLSEQTGLTVKYVPSNDYAALVTAFKRGDMQLVWFGGLTGVQAMAAVPGSLAIAQRPRDAEFHSKFLVQKDIAGDKLTDLKGLTFTFGSESSTSGHLMPRYFLMQAGIDADKDLKGKPNFSGSHDKTWKLVETGAFQAGVLNEAVWDSAVKDGKVDLTKVREFYRTPPYFDYHWVAHVDLDKTYGVGMQEKLKQALLTMRPETSPAQKEILDLLATDRFIETKHENYEAIRQVATQLGILK